MKILLCLQPGISLGEKIAEDAELATALNHTRLGPLHVFKKWIDADSPLVPRVLALDTKQRPRFFRDLHFTAGELAGSSRLEVRTKVTIRQSHAAVEATRAAYQAEPLQTTASLWPVRLPQRLYLSKAPAPNTIAHVDQWTEEYVMDVATADGLRASTLTGHRLLPVWRPKPQRPEPQFGMHLSTQELLPPALRTYSAFEAIPCGPKVPPRRHGLIAYAAGALAGAPDFARTSEPWAAWDIPRWTVSQAVRSWYEQRGLRGWCFWPVLEDGTRLYEEHESGWQRAIAVVRAGEGSFSV